jgi:exonuclease SbcC
MIKEINGKNLKGQTFNQELTGKDIFIGRNGSGKTTRIQAIGGSMLGYIPGNGKTAHDTFKLATGNEVTIGMKVDEFEFSRTFERQEKYDKKMGKTNISISESVVVLPGQGETNDTQKRARIENEIGSFPVMLDFNNFLELSDAKRRDFVYSLSPITSNSWDREKIEQHLCDTLLTLQLKTNNPDHYEIMRMSIEESMTKYPKNFEVSAGLQAMIDWVSVQLSAANTKKKDSQGAVRQIADIKNEQEETDRNIAGEKKELEELQKQLLNISGQIAKDRERKKIIDQRLSRIEELNKLIETPETAPTVDIGVIKQQISELEKQIINPIDIQVELKPIKDKEKSFREKYETLQTEDAQVKQKILSVNEQIITLKDAFNKAGELGGKCILHHAIECPKDFSGAGEYLVNLQTKADAMVKDLTEKKISIQDQITKVKNDIDISQKEQTDIIQKAQDVTASNTSVNNQITGLKKILTDAETATERRNNQIKLYQDELDRLVNTPTEPIGDIEIMEKQIIGLEERIGGLKTSIEAKEKAKQTILLLNQSMLENKKAELKAICLKSISDELGPKGIQGELVKGILAPIKADIHSNLKLMGFNFEPFFQTESETGKEIFQFGWINEKGHAVNFDALSAGQQTIFLAAMMMTIIDRANPKLRLLVMDNLNHLDRINFQMLINGLNQLAHKLDNIILAGAIEFPFESEGWKVWVLSQGAVSNGEQAA